MAWPWPPLQLHLPALVLAPLVTCSGHRHYCLSLICQTSLPQGLCTCHLPGTLLTQTFSWAIFHDFSISIQILPIQEELSWSSELKWALSPPSFLLHSILCSLCSWTLLITTFYFIKRLFLCWSVAESEMPECRGLRYPVCPQSPRI